MFQRPLAVLAALVSLASAAHAVPQAILDRNIALADIHVDQSILLDRVSDEVESAVKIPANLRGRLMCVPKVGGGLNCIEVLEELCPGSLTIMDNEGRLIECSLDCHGGPDANGDCDCDVTSCG